MRTAILFLGAVAALAGPDDSKSERHVPPGAARLTDCIVEFISEYEVEVAAEEAGVVVMMDAREGMQVKEGDLLARINDSKSQMAKRVALAEHKVAETKASNDVNERYARAAAKVAGKLVEVNQAANKNSPNTVTETEIAKLKLDEKRAILQIEQAQLEHEQDRLTAEAKQAEVEATEDDIQRRRIKAPLDGIVVKVTPHKGEWVNPGDPVVKIVRLDRLRVKGYLNVKDFAPSEVESRPVEVLVYLERGRREKFTGKVVFVDPSVESNGEYSVWAEVENRQKNESWVLRPGMSAELTIDADVAEGPRRERQR